MYLKAIIKEAKVVEKRVLVTVAVDLALTSEEAVQEVQAVDSVVDLKAM